MSNTNRDYAIVYDVKNSTLVLSRPLVFYITDKNTSNIFVRLVTKTNIGNGVDQYTDIENASNYIVLMRTIKPNDEVINIKATQREPESIFEFDLTEDFKDIPGTYICELMISTIVNSKQELITSDSFTYEVKRSVLSRIDEIIEHEDLTVEKLLNDLDATKAELSSRIDNLASLTEGSTTGDAELIDGRVGVNGKIYDNIGGAIRGQVGSINSNLNNLFESQYTHILDVPIEWEIGGWNSNTGETTDPIYSYFTIRGYMKNITRNIDINVEIDPGYRLIVGKYNKSDNSYVGAEYHSESYILSYNNSYIYRFSFHNLNDYNNNVRITDINKVALHCKFSINLSSDDEIQDVKENMKLISESTMIIDKNVLSQCDIYNNKAIGGYDTATLAPNFISKKNEFVAKYVIPQKGKIKIGRSDIEYQYLMFVDANGRRIANWGTSAIKEGSYIEKVTSDYIIINIDILRNVSVLPNVNAVYIGYTYGSVNKYIHEINVYDEDDINFIDLKQYCKKSHISIPILSEKDKYSWECIHHDNFNREPNNEKLWDIGTNGNNVFHFEYSSPYSDYPTVDDGFRILNNKVKVENSVISDNKDIVLRLVRNVFFSDNILLQFSAPKTGKIIGVVFNYQNNANYNAIYTTNNVEDQSKYDIILFSVVDNKGKTNTLGTFSYGEINNMSLFLSSVGSALYVDDYFINTIDIKFNKKFYVGLYCKKIWNNFEMKFFNVFNMTFKTVINPNRALDNGTSPLYMMNLQIPDNRQDCYQIVNDIKFGDGCAQKFNLKKGDNIVSGSKRCEVAFKMNTMPLKKYKIEFDVLFPADFISDNIANIFYQFHDQPSGNDIVTVLDPMIALYVKQGKIFCEYIGMEKHSGSALDYNNKTNFEVGNLETDKWYHFEMEVKEGYMIEHNPSFKLYVNNKLIFKGTKPNCFNQPKSGYPKYGLYIFDWKHTVGTVTERTVYIDNFIMTY